ncbi:hypothetical protein HPB48_008069 [Haemaphysalis longicornis]|uniref:Uncharacterized protein n=1 Tax=Haemaphysalis longicornis TaxID=44386 RepID=A0A9J6FZ94_HAELO|nr:hypothetical protein HPB48_008069 [Haemaphysalis longicornis]
MGVVRDEGADETLEAPKTREQMATKQDYEAQLESLTVTVDDKLAASEQRFARLEEMIGDIGVSAEEHERAVRLHGADVETYGPTPTSPLGEVCTFVRKALTAMENQQNKTKKGNFEHVFVEIVSGRGYKKDATKAKDLMYDATEPGFRLITSSKQFTRTGLTSLQRDTTPDITFVGNGGELP